MFNAFSNPKIIASLSALMAKLPPTQILEIQNAVQKYMTTQNLQDLEQVKSMLPESFFLEMQQVIQNDALESYKAHLNAPSVKISDVKEARVVVLTALSEGEMSVEEAYQALFSGE